MFLLIQESCMLHVFVQWIGEKDFLSIHYRMWRWVGKALKCRSRGRGVGGGGLGGGSTVQVCLLQYIQLQYDEGGRLEVGGEMMSIYRMKGSRRPGQPDFTLLPLPPILTPPWVYSAWFACLASFCLILLLYQLWNEKVRRTGPSPFLPHPSPPYFMVTCLHVICLFCKLLVFFGNI